jgi:hypothetical protein
LSPLGYCDGEIQDSGPLATRKLEGALLQLFAKRAFGS